ncbi:queuosine precursor transporter, partial [Calditrichota bacterium]
TEVYGFRIARRTIWIGLACQTVAMGVFALVGMLPFPAEWEAQTAYNQILTSTSRIMLASFIAYLFGSWSNDALMSLLKRYTHGKHLWTRTIGSTLVGEGLDTVLFCIIAFYGVFSNDLLLTIIISNYIFKCGVEVLATPFTYLACNAVKRFEELDVIDNHTDYSPFSLRLGDNPAPDNV